MKCKIKVSCAGSKFSVVKGETRSDLPDFVVKDLIKAGYAEPIKEQNAKPKRKIKASAQNKAGD